MIKRHRTESGLTYFEIIVTIVILVILAAVSISPFVKGRGDSLLISFADSLVAELEKSKLDAVSGKNGSSGGVSFSADSYTVFIGSSYNPSDPQNRTYAVPQGLLMTNSIPGGTIVFARLTGQPTATGTIMVSNPDISASETVTVENGGDITVIK